jgi:hypothetical protein
MKKVTDLKKQLTAMSTESALLCIIQKGAEAKTFFWDGQLWTPVQAKRMWEKDLLTMACGGFGVIRFFGGPPGNGQWYDGTILSMLCDIILFNENTLHLTTVEKLGA